MLLLIPLIHIALFEENENKAPSKMEVEEGRDENFADAKEDQLDNLERQVIQKLTYWALGNFHGIIFLCFKNSYWLFRLQ